MPTLRYVIVDVLTDRALACNQLAVFTDGRSIDAETMQALACEVGFSETTLVLPAERKRCGNRERVEVGGRAVVVAHGESPLGQPVAG